MKTGLSLMLRNIARTKDEKTATELALKLFEEGGELAREVLRHAEADGTAYRGKPSREKLIEEMADCYIVLVAIAERHDVTDTELETWIKAKSQKWEGVVGEGFRRKKREEAVEAAMDKIVADVSFAAPEAWEHTKEKIRTRLERMADWLLPDRGKWE